MKFEYNFSYLNKVIYFFAIPLIVIFLIFIIGLIIYSKKTKNKNNKYIYNMNFYSLLLAIIVCGFLTAFSIGFSINFSKSILSNKIIDNNNLLLCLSIIFPFIPFLFLILFIILFYKNLKSKKHNYVTDSISVLKIEEEKNETDEVI